MFNLSFFTFNPIITIKIHKMRKLFFALFFFLFAGIFICTSGQDKLDRDVIPDGTLKKLLLAQDLANYGYEHQDAFSLLAAADILANSPVGELVAKLKTSTGGVLGKIKKESIQANLLDPKKLIADAKNFGKDDPHLLALAKKIKSNKKTRGNVEGPVMLNDKIEAKASDTYLIDFEGGKGAEIAVIGDGDTDLDLYVYDQNDNLIEKDEDDSDKCYVSWVPKWTGTYKVKIKNRGDVYNNYTIYSN
jgi:hypothetical protein